MTFSRSTRGPKHATSTQNDVVEPAPTPASSPIHARLSFGTGRGFHTGCATGSYHAERTKVRIELSPVDSTPPTDHDPTMRRSSSQRLLTCLLLLVLGALAAGLPSHSHGVAGVVELVAPDHHGHGVILTEQTDRVPTVVVPHAVPAGTLRIADRPVLVASTVPPVQTDLPRERAPPSTSPRAPPLPI